MNKYLSDLNASMAAHVGKVGLTKSYKFGQLVVFADISRTNVAIVNLMNSTVRTLDTQDNWILSKFNNAEDRNNGIWPNDFHVARPIYIGHEQKSTVTLTMSDIKAGDVVKVVGTTDQIFLAVNRVDLSNRLQDTTYKFIDLIQPDMVLAPRKEKTEIRFNPVEVTWTIDPLPWKTS